MCPGLMKITLEWTEMADSEEWTSLKTQKVTMKEFNEERFFAFEEWFRNQPCFY